MSARLALFTTFVRKTHEKTGDLAATEIQYSRICVISIVQRAAFSDEIHDFEYNRLIQSSSVIVSLNPKFTTEKVLCIGSRLDHASIIWEHEKYPIILFSDARITLSTNFTRNLGILQPIPLYTNYASCIGFRVAGKSS